MNDDNPTNYRDEMLARFRESIRRPMEQRFFDEDELLEIFDYAGDVNDDYLRLEALLCAAHFYPDSEDFRERKAVYYSQWGDDLRNKCLDDNSDANGMIWDLLRLRSQYDGSYEKTISEIENIVDRYDDFTDEETIQLIDIVSALGQVGWIKKNLPKLRAKAGYLNILLFEIAVAADLNGDAYFSVAMLEELTEIEPYNAYYWMMLAKEYAEVDRQEDAQSAIGYSLAINPYDPQALLIKARLLFTNGTDYDEVINLLENALNQDGDNIEVVKFLATVYNTCNRTQDAADVLHNFLSRHPSEVLNIIPDLVMYLPDDTDELLDTFYRYNDDNSKLLWITWSNQLRANGMTELSNKVIEAYQRNSGVSIDSLSIIERYFKEQKFEDALITLGNYLDNQDSIKGELPTMAIIHLISMVKLGEYEKAYSFCRFLESSTSKEKCQSFAQRIEYLGMSGIVKFVESQLESGNFDKEYWKHFDPLELW